MIRIPDVAFLSIEKFPGSAFLRDAALHFGPDLAVEVLSKETLPKRWPRSCAITSRLAQ